MSGDPAALLLDEITAPLDELSQARVSRLLSESFRDRTILSVIHRLPAVRGMDRIVVMDAGRIVQDGSWEALSSSPGLFARLLARETGAADGPSEASGTERAVSGPSEIEQQGGRIAGQRTKKGDLGRLSARNGAALRTDRQKVEVYDSAFVRLHRDDVLSAVRSSPDLAVRLLAALSRIAARA